MLRLLKMLVLPLVSVSMVRCFLRLPVNRRLTGRKTGCRN